MYSVCVLLGIMLRTFVWKMMLLLLALHWHGCSVCLVEKDHRKMCTCVFAECVC